MATLRIHIDLEGVETPEQILALGEASIRWAQIGLSRFVYQRLARRIPVRTGRLRRSFKFRKLKNGGRFYFTKGGFYYKFQDGLEEDMIRILEDSIHDLIPWAVRHAREELGI